MFLALRQLWPHADVKMNCTIGSSVFIQVQGAEDFDVDALKYRMAELIAEDIPLQRRRVNLSDAIDHYVSDGQEDKARLLKWRKFDYFDEYAYRDFADYYYGEMMPSTAYLTVWDLRPIKGGFLFI